MPQTITVMPIVRESRLSLKIALVRIEPPNIYKPKASLSIIYVKPFNAALCGNLGAPEEKLSDSSTLLALI